MTLKPYQPQVAIDWLAIPGNMEKECSGQDRHTLICELTTLDMLEVDDKYSHLDANARLDYYLTEVQISNRLEKMLRKHRNGLIKPEYTNKAYEQGLVGGETVKARNARHNPTNNLIKNPIKNPIANAKRKEINKEAAEAYLRENLSQSD